MRYADRIERTIDLKAPPARVWKALTDHEEFGQWFRVDLEGPFEVGEVSHGQITYPGYEHMKWEARVKTMEPEKLFAFTWVPYGGDPDVDYSNDPNTLVEFKLERTSEGTRLSITESGFDGIPDDSRRIGALRENTRGWDVQVGHIVAHVEA